MGTGRVEITVDGRLTYRSWIRVDVILLHGALREVLVQEPVATSRFRNHAFSYFTDNMVMYDVIRKGTSRPARLHSLVRELKWLELLHQCQLEVIVGFTSLAWSLISITSPPLAVSNLAAPPMKTLLSVFVGMSPVFPPIFGNVSTTSIF